MAVTESSAIARFVDSVRHAPIVGSRRRVVDIPRLATQELPLNTMQPLRRSKVKVVFVGLLLAGFVAGGVYLFGSEKGNELLDQAKSVAGFVETESEENADDVLAVVAGETVPTAVPVAASPTAALPAVEEEEIAKAVAVPTVTPTVAHDAGVDIIVKPAGARVFLDGKDIGQAPLRVSRLAPGEYVIDVEATDGYANKQVSVTLEQGRSTVLNIELDAVSRGGVIVSSIPSTAPSVTPIPTPKPRTKRAPVRRGPKRRARKAQTRKRARKMVAKRGGAKRAVSSGSGKTGTLMIGAKPSCKIYIDGKYTGKRTPQRSIKLKVGRHNITLVNDEYNIRKSLRVDIKAGKSTRVVKNLTSYM